MEMNWYAVYTKPRWEKKIAETLVKKKIENYCPLNKILRQWHDRKKIIYEPLFKSYVFVRAHENFHHEIKRVDGIINFVYWLKKPAVISDHEIDSIKRFLNDHTDVKLERVSVRLNDTVKVMSGPLMYQEGNVVATNYRTVNIIIPSLGYKMIAQVEKQNVKIIVNAAV
ncbi:MAG TPA: UpxY family transcription antiterminator [Puia sp.]|jgi:transcription antitermination factor NusG|nr:UpxY family transcription antiterminator [Puia sp.]